VKSSKFEYLKNVHFQKNLHIFKNVQIWNLFNFF
jgi:hypothetical protein